MSAHRFIFTMTRNAAVNGLSPGSGYTVPSWVEEGNTTIAVDAVKVTFECNGVEYVDAIGVTGWVSGEPTSHLAPSMSD